MKETENMRTWKKGDRVVDPTTGERGTVYAIQEANPPWHDGGCPLVTADRERARNSMGHAWHNAVPEAEAKTCGTCGGVMFTPTCTADKHVEARLVERIANHFGAKHRKRSSAVAKEIRTTFHPKKTHA